MSAKNLDSHNRWRNKTVAFRVSPEEDAQIETAVRLTGLTKQDYIIWRLLNRDVVVQGNPRVYKALRNQLAAVLNELRHIEAGANVSDELLDTINMIAAIMDGMKEDWSIGWAENESGCSDSACWRRRGTAGSENHWPEYSRRFDRKQSPWANFGRKAAADAADERPSVSVYRVHERVVRNRLPKPSACHWRSALLWHLPLCRSTQGGQVIPYGAACLPCQHRPLSVGLHST